MARTVRNGKIDTRSARAKLTARREPYWTVVSRGCAMGYRKGNKGGTWVARFRAADGKQRYSALGVADDAREADGAVVLSYSQAQALARDWFAEQERDADSEAGAPSPYTVGQALDDYMAWFRKHRKSVRDTELAIKAHIRPTLGETDIDQLTTPDIRQWHRRLAETPARLRTRIGEAQKHREVSADSEGRRARQATPNRVLTVLKAALNHAWKEGKAASDDAWRRVKPFAKADAARLRYLTKDECHRLLNACRPDFRHLIQAALLAGCRYGELTRATVGDFIADAGALLIRESKSGKPRHVPLDGDAREFFTTMTAGRSPTDTLFLRDDGKPWGKSYQIRPLLEACRAARIEPAVGFHGLRHTWASHRVMAGAPLMVVASVLGHSDTRMVEKHYGHLAPSYVRRVIDDTALGIGADTASTVSPIR